MAGPPDGHRSSARPAFGCAQDLSFIRAVLHGLVPAAAAQPQRYHSQYLVDEQVAGDHLRRVFQIAADILGGIEDLAAAKALSGYPEILVSQYKSTTCELPTGSQPVPVTPSLDESAEEFGSDDFGEREIWALAWNGMCSRWRCPMQKRVRLPLR